jgi:hypothetical protein
MCQYLIWSVRPFLRGRKGIHNLCCLAKTKRLPNQNTSISQINTIEINMTTPLTTLAPAANDHQEYDDDSSIATDASFSDNEGSFHSSLFESFASSTFYIDLSGKLEEELSTRVVQRAQPRPTRPRRSQTMQNQDVDDRPRPFVVAVVGDDEEDSVVLLRSRAANRDSNHISWSDKILEGMEDIDIVDAPLNDVARNGETIGRQQKQGNSYRSCERMRSLNKRQVGRQWYPNE